MLLLSHEVIAQPATTAEAEALAFANLEQQVLQHRAIEAVIWGMPAVNRDLMYQAMAPARPGPGQPTAVLVEAARLEEPDPHAQHRRHLSHAIL